MWADLRAAEDADRGGCVSVDLGPGLDVLLVRAIAGSFRPPAIAGLVFAAVPAAECWCPACLAARHARAGCDGCSDLGVLCPDHDPRP